MEDKLSDLVGLGVPFTPLTHLRSIARRLKDNRHPPISTIPVKRLGGDDNIEAASFRRGDSATVNRKAAPKWRLRPDQRCGSTFIAASSKMA
jgi:hypothetical protein